MSDCKKECEHDDIDETNRKSRPAGEACSDIQERAQENTVLVSGEKGIHQPSALCDKKEENEDHVYSVVHKKRKGGASFQASTPKKSSDRPQGGTRGLPVNRASYVDSVVRSSHPTDSGLENNTEAAETPEAGGNSEYLYAAVHKTKKKKPPQVIHFTNSDKILLFFSFSWRPVLPSVLFNLRKKIDTFASLNQNIYRFQSSVQLRYGRWACF